MARGQLSLFIIIGIVILAGVILLFVSGTEEGVEGSDNRDVDVYMKECANNKAERALAIAGKTGGKFEEEITFTAYLDEMPSIKGIKSNISKEIRQGVKECAEYDFAGKNVSAGDLDIEIRFNRTTKIIIEDFYSVKTKDKTHREDYAAFEFEIPFMKIYKTAEFMLMDEHMHDTTPLRKEGIKIEGMDKGDYELWAVSSEEYVFAFAKRKN